MSAHGKKPIAPKQSYGGPSLMKFLAFVAIVIALGVLYIQIMQTT